MDALLEVLSKVGFDPKVALANLVNFLLIFWVIKKFAWKPLKDIVSKRQAVIAEGLSKAQEADTLRIEAEEDYKKRLGEADQEAFAIVSDAHKQGKNVLEHAHAKAHKDSESIVEMCRGQIEQERKDMEKDVSRQTANLIVDGLEKVLKEKMTADKDKAFVENLLRS